MNVDREWTARRYLLAQLSPEDEERFEEQLLEDRTLRALTEAAEADLHDEFVRGELSSKDREIFFARFGHRIERVDFAHALMARTRRRVGRRWLLPVAAALVVAAALAAFWSSRPLPRPETPPQTTSAEPTPVALPAVPARVPANEPQTTVAFTIALSAAREDGATPRLDLSHDVDAISLRVRIPAGDEYPRYEIHWTVGGADVWTGPATRDASEAVVEATIPAARLEARRYEIIVVGIDQEGAREILGTRAVVVHR